MTQSHEVKLLLTHLGSKQTLVKLDLIYAWIVMKVIKAWIVEESMPADDSIKVCSTQYCVRERDATRVEIWPVCVLCFS